MDQVVHVEDAPGGPVIVGRHRARGLGRPGGPGELLMAAAGVPLLLWSALVGDLVWVAASLAVVAAVVAVVVPRRVRRHGEVLERAVADGAAIVRFRGLFRPAAVRPAHRDGGADGRTVPYEVSVAQGLATAVVALAVGIAVLALVDAAQRPLMPAAMLALGLPAWSQPLAVASVERRRGVVLARARFGRDTVWVSLGQPAPAVVHEHADAPVDVVPPSEHRHEVRAARV